MEFDVNPLESRGPLYKIIRTETETLESASSRIQRDVKNESAWEKMGVTPHLPEIKQTRNIVLFDRVRLPLPPVRTVYQAGT